MSPEAAVQHQLEAYNARDRPFEVAAVYEVIDGLIRTAWFFAG